jgi:predicted transcriptional regulator
MQALKAQVRTKPVSLKLDASLKARLDVIAVAKDRSAHWLIQNAIETFVVKEEQQEKLWLEAKAIHEHYELTGMHVSEDRADAWLAQLEAGNDIDPPECQS